MMKTALITLALVALCSAPFPALVAGKGQALSVPDFTKVAKGSPADGVLNVGDVILGVGGKPFSYDPRTEFGKALTSAETTSRGREAEPSVATKKSAAYKRTDDIIYGRKYGMALTMTMSKTMSAAVLHGIKDLRIDERTIPELEASKALVRVRRGGICGSDVHYFEEGRFGSFAVTAPFVLGHEVAGEVVAVADGVSQPAVGQRVVVNPSRQCGHCDYCRSGRGNLCRHVRMLGSASRKPPTNGWFSEYLLVGAEQCFPVPPQIDDGLGAMIEPFAVALHALKRAGSVMGKPVIVTGGGPIGLLTAIAARACGATTIAVSDPVAERRQMALQVGADRALDPTEASFKDQVAALTGDGFEILFEASGAVPALAQAFEVVRWGGTIVQIGVYSAPEISLPVNQLLVRELQFVGSFRHGNVWEEAIRLVASGRVNLQPLISRVLPLKQAAEALALAFAKTGVVKVQIDLN